MLLQALEQSRFFRGTQTETSLSCSLRDCLANVDRSLEFPVTILIRDGAVCFEGASVVNRVDSCANESVSRRKRAYRLFEERAGYALAEVESVQRVEWSVAH